MDNCDVAIVGAGPYGLSAAAHLSQLKGLEVRLFGEPMSFWERHMPVKMALRSPWAGSHLSDPLKSLTLDAYRELNGNQYLSYPVPLAEFIKYGHWFHNHIPIKADRRKVREIGMVTGGGYHLHVEDGNEVRARRVVIAGGIQPFAYRPGIFSSLPATLVSHTSEIRDFSPFRNKRVLVIGGGQSALESGAFLYEAGADVELIIRNPELHWLGRTKWMHRKGVSWMFYGSADVGPAGISLLVQHPHLFRRLPRSMQSRWAKRAVRPAVSERLAASARNIRICTSCDVLQVRVEGECLRIRLNDGGERPFDHVVLGTGYRVNVAQYPFLSSEVLSRLDIVDGYPRLHSGFESSLAGLHFLGAPAVWSFGPLMRFVAGTEFAAPMLCKHIVRAKQHSIAKVTSRNAFESNPAAPAAVQKPAAAACLPAQGE